MEGFSDGGSTPPASTIPFHVMGEFNKKSRMVKVF